MIELERRLEAQLRAKRDAGQKLLVVYLTGGLGDEWIDIARAVAHAGADAIEIGIPFSDPVMDGPTIQQASLAALQQGATPEAIITDCATLDIHIPVAVMTYANIVMQMGETRMAERLAQCGISGAIIPDLPLEECDDWANAADAAGVATVLLCAPTTPHDRLVRLAARSRGFFYAIGLMGVTGERSSVARSATEIAVRAKAVTDLPVLVGVGVSTPAQARELSVIADGVVVGSALVRRILEGQGPKGAADFVAELRDAIDQP